MHKVLLAAQTLTTGAADVANIVDGAPDIPASVNEAHNLLLDMFNRTPTPVIDTSAPREEHVDPPPDIDSHPRHRVIWDQMVEQLELVKPDIELDAEDMAALATALYLLHQLLATQSV